MIYLFMLLTLIKYKLKPLVLYFDVCTINIQFRTFCGKLSVGYFGKFAYFAEWSYKKDQENITEE